MAKSEEEYKKDLKKMYHSFYKNNCCYNKCCKGMCIGKDMDNIQFDHAAKIGEDYGKVGNYKILIVGKESTSQQSAAEKPHDDITTQTNTHYRGTLYIRALLLAGRLLKVPA